MISLPLTIDVMYIYASYVCIVMYTVQLILLKDVVQTMRDLI